ncbi:hypothetical protein QTJ16_000927 [Diplocarpon rosae]|uniref:Chromo domain-containing protein n=1 Tax=Diplocarpon rosae TaxID=946125 RepID=A0AAD9WFS2_9HELO|nr:hypothetical protein QTJ16_000927 [Diplocarpon rosae]
MTQKQGPIIHAFSRRVKRNHQVQMLYPLTSVRASADTTPIHVQTLPYEIPEEMFSPHVVEICFQRGESVTKPTPQVANSSFMSAKSRNAAFTNFTGESRAGGKEKRKTNRYPRRPFYEVSPERKCARATPHQPTSITVQHLLSSSRETSAERTFAQGSGYLETPARSPDPAKRRQEPATPAPFRDHFADWADLEGIDWEPLLEVSSPPEKFTVPPVFGACRNLPSSPSRPSSIDPQELSHVGVVENEAWDLRSIVDMASRGLGHSFEEGEKHENVGLLLQDQLQAELSHWDEGGSSKKQLKRARSPEVAKPNKGRRKKRLDRARMPDTAEPDEEKAADELEGEAGDDTQSRGVPAKFMAERTGLGGTQLLVKWKSYPNEKDWTWELESELLESVPELVEAWKKQKREGGDAAGALLENLVEKILGKRKLKGLPHYLVKWEGFADAKDRTWEPCDRLAVDVPDIVAAYESKKKSKR